LRVLNLAGARVTDEGLKEIAKLAKLHNSACGQIRRWGPSRFWKLPITAALKELSALPALESSTFRIFRHQRCSRPGKFEESPGALLRGAKITDAGLKEIAGSKICALSYCATLDHRRCSSIRLLEATRHLRSLYRDDRRRLHDWPGWRSCACWICRFASSIQQA